MGSKPLTPLGVPTGIRRFNHIMQFMKMLVLSRDVMIPGQCELLVCNGTGKNRTTSDLPDAKY